MSYGESGVAVRDDMVSSNTKPARGDSSPTVADALDELRRRRALLQEQVGMLREQLGPVLRPERPSEVRGKWDRPENSSDVFAVIAEESAVLSQTTDELVEIRARLHL